MTHTVALKCKGIFVKHLHLMRAWSAWNKNSKVLKIYTEPRAQWNHNNHINTPRNISLFTSNTNAHAQMWARHSESRGEKMGITHTHTCAHTHTHTRPCAHVHMRKQWRTTAHRHAHRQAWHSESRGEKMGLEDRLKWCYWRRVSERVG